MIRKLRAFGAFWYDFIIGDDWRVALAVVAALAATYGVSRTSLPSWWIVPTAIILMLPLSLWRATKPKQPQPAAINDAPPAPGSPAKV